MKLGLCITLDATPSARGIALVVEPIDAADRITAQRSRLVVELWHETPNLIRGTISHASGAIAHFQGGKPLADFARTLQLRIERDEEELP